MAMHGNLKDMAVADLIQHNCQDRKTARLTIEHNHQQAILFFKEGAVVHAILDDQQGEEVVYQTLTWLDGQFTLDVGPEPPTTSITRSWSGLLLNGAKRLDEANNLSTNNLISIQEDNSMSTRKTRSEKLAETLAELLADSSDIAGAAIVGVDGLVYSANVPQKDLDEEMVGATSAAVLGLSKRSVKQLSRGNFKQTLVQGDDGNIIVASLNDETLVVGLTAANVNLGMAFAEIRVMVKKLNELL